MQLRTRILLAVVVAAMVAPTAAATHMRYYAQVFIEHDDQGRSDEPDFASTAVLGLPVGNCVVDFTPADPGCVADTALPAPPPAHAAVIAPGCTDDSGRRPSGLCGMWTIGVYHPELQDPSLATPPKTVGVQGMSAPNAPGRFSATQGTTIRFLDIQTVQDHFVPGTTGTHYIELNRKLADTGVNAALKGADPNLGGDVLVGDAGIWAWYGNWVDKNGNGVIDHLGTDGCTIEACDGSGGVQEDNEFVWVGSCFQFGGSAPPLGQKYCKQEASVSFPVWIWPGNHHAFCGGTLPIGGDELSCSTLSAELPAHQPICFVDALSGDLTTGTGQTPVFCDQNLATFDDTDEDAFGDPIFGPQGGLWPDHDTGMDDRTGDVGIGSRHWVYGFGWGTRFYDQSTLVSTLIMGGPTAQAPLYESRARVPYDLRQFQSFDVDSFRTVNPAAEDLLQNQVKPAARGPWVTFRDNLVPVQAGIDAVRNQRALDTSATTGPLDDNAINPGFAREPNTVFDRFPAARFNVFAPGDPIPDADERRNGWLNDYSGHRDQWHVFADVTGTRMYYTNLVWRNPLNGNCFPQMCVSGGTVASSNQYLNQGANANRQRTLEPGVWLFGGFVGAWRDRAQTHHEVVADFVASLATPGQVQNQTFHYVAPHDGWVGSIVNTTGTWKYRGYPGPNEPGAPSCTIAGVSASRHFGECNPYWDATVFEADIYAGPFQDPGVDVENPQDPGSAEFEGIFPALVGAENEHLIKVYPAGANGNCDTRGTWTVPAMLWKRFVNWRVGDTAAIVDFSGTSGAASVIAMRSGFGGGLGTEDFLVLPQGNLGLTVCTEFATTAVVDLPLQGISVREPIREVDVYAPWA